jgi:hypothetical protein
VTRSVRSPGCSQAGVTRVYNHSGTPYASCDEESSARRSPLSARSAIRGEAVSRSVLGGQSWSDAES